MLGLVAGVAPAPAEARDLLILRNELRRGELQLRRHGLPARRRHDSTREHRDDRPRRPAAAHAAGPEPVTRWLYLRDGSVREGPFESLDARRVITPARTYERREVRWIYLAPPPTGVSGGGTGAGGAVIVAAGTAPAGSGSARWAGVACSAIPTPAAVAPSSPGPFERFTRCGCVRAHAPETWVSTLTKPPSESASGRWYRIQPAAATGLRARGRVTSTRGRRTAFSFREDRRVTPPTGSMSARPSTGIPRPPTGPVDPRPTSRTLHGYLGGRGSGPGATPHPGRLGTDDEGRVRGDA